MVPFPTTLPSESFGLKGFFDSVPPEVCLFFSAAGSFQNVGKKNPYFPYFCGKIPYLFPQGCDKIPFDCICPNSAVSVCCVRRPLELGIDFTLLTDLRREIFNLRRRT